MKLSPAMQLLHPGPSLSGDTLSVYVDESVHDRLGYIISAFVCSSLDLETPAQEALWAFGLTPGVDEFKSGELMVANETMRALREHLLRLVVQQAKIAILISPTDDKPSLGAELIHTLELIIKRNGLRFDNVTGHFDRGLFRTAAEGHRLAASSDTLSVAALHFDQDSRYTLGLQVADAVAHVVAQVLKEQITGAPKSIPIGGGASPYPDDAEAPLGWVLLTTIRDAFFVRPYLVGRSPMPEEASMKPVIIPDEQHLDAIIDAWQHPELLGWGVFVSESVPKAVRAPSESVFSRLWLGCIA